ncbi:MAG TPA: sugar phosphate isomerase/epimerase [Pirellulales bacterium]|nr:sugar phosphate isomerase/epimerase [Pirellulales bacterium]
MTRLSRRRLLTIAAGGAAAATLGWPRRARAAAQPGFVLGMQSYSLRSFPVDKALDDIQELGLHTVEFFNAHLAINSTQQKIDEMKQKLAKHQIKLLAHGVNGFGKDHETNRRVFEFAKKAGIRNISADPSPDAFDSLDKLVDEFDVRIAIHNHGPGARYNKVDDVLKAVQGRHKLIGACADLGHYIRSGEDPVEVIRKLQGRLYGIHLKDFDEPKGNAKGVILGKGQLDVVAVFRALKKVEFPADGALSIEYEEHADNPMPDLRECVAIARDAEQKANA